MNQLFFGDNLYVLREHLANESVDIIYLFGEQRAEHPAHQLDLNFKKAKRETHGQQKELL